MESIWKKELRPGAKWSGGIGKNRFIQITAAGDNANVSALFYNFYDRAEKYNMPDTLKEQHKAFLTENDLIMSDNGRVLAAIVKDTTGWNDTICGYTTRDTTDARYGITSFATKGNDWLHSGAENFKIELIRNGMRPRDIGACVNFFSKVTIAEDGGMHYEPAHCKKGDTVILKTEMAMLLVLSNTPNPLNSSGEYPNAPVQIEVFEARETTLADPWYAKSPEAVRAYSNTRDYHRLLGI